MIKVDVISGFLGAGKTTLIKKLFESKLKDEKVVLIENEFGEIGVDGSFLKDSQIEIKEINSGCICCSLVGDFSKSMVEIVEKFSPERIIIEPSGVGKLSDILKAVEKVGGELKLNIVATVIDGGKCKMYHKNFGEFYNDQIANANVVVVSKTENLSKEKIETAIEIVREINSSATVITTPVSQFDADKVLEELEKNGVGYDDFAQEVLNEAIEEHHCCHHHDHDEEEGEHHCCHHHDHDEEEGEHHCCHHHDHGEEEHHHHHHADDVFTSWGKETAKSFSSSQLDGILSVLASENSNMGIILRSKGVVKASDCDKWYYFDLVAGEYEVRLGSPDVIGKICVIGSKLDQNAIEKLFFAE